MEARSGSSEEGSLKETVYKVEGGKTIRPRLWVEGDRIRKVEIYGDFFMYPEEAVFDLECALTGTLTGEVGRRVEAFFSERGDVKIMGANPADFTRAILKAIGEKSG
ncbi:MAG: lipoate--protein ligase family protein [Thermoplasmata archaeon]|nr:MAG: lipoate--protein ligase family protein [Thermoplasmata archaeon]RLF71051.1 MAG: lipoate--protein ligase family protein [Thermoplasmata archaeon]RLF71344.1 MAG: lipoate--protein ligase family protein [Thermoplasmata archaeon]HDD60089.1 lipoate--protein ligase family protein [Euryarchaeota archaeon]